MPAIRTCPNCQRSIPALNLALAATIGRLVCPHCSRSLEGNGYVVALAVAQSLFLGGTLMALIVLGLLWTVVETIVGLAVVAFVVWIGAWIAAWRRGDFTAKGQDYLEPKSIRRYFLAVAIVAVVLVVFMNFYVGSNLTALIALAAWVLAPLAIFYPNYRHLANDYSRATGAVVLSLWAGTVGFAVIGFLVYAIPNFPKEGTFEGHESIEFGPIAQQDGWDVGRALLDEFDLRFRNELVFADTALREHDYTSERVRNLIAATERPRNALLEIFATNVVSLPSSGVSLASPVPRYGILLPMARIELAEIKRLTAGNDQDSHETAAIKYLRLWTLATQLLNGGDLLDKFITSMDLTIDLVNFYIDSSARGTLLSGGFLVFNSLQIQESLNGALKDGIDSEFVGLRNTLLERTDALCALEPGVLCRFDLPWPFFDKERTFREQFESVVEAKELSDPLFHEIEAEWDDFRDRVGDRLSDSYFVNPVGPLASSIYPFVGGLIVAKETVRSHLLAFEYFAASSVTNHFGLAPTDPLTGELFAVNVTDDVVEISSSYAVNGEKPIDYKILRRPGSGR